MAGTTRITTQWLKDHFSGDLSTLSSSRAFDAVVKLKHLARWWAHPQVLSLAACHAHRLDPLGYGESARPWRNPIRKLDATSGVCWIAVVNRHRESLPLMAPALVLPLQWRLGSEHDQRLPKGLLDLANQVYKELYQLGGTTEQWSLHPYPNSLLWNVSLYDLEAEWQSGWVPLGLGYLLATWEGKPETNLWASAYWEAGRGIQAVEGLQEKVQLACEFGATHFFVPFMQVQELERWVRDHGLQIHICGLGSDGSSSAHDFLDDTMSYLEQLDLPISPKPEKREHRKKFFLRISTETKANRFYIKYIMPEIVPQLRSQVPDSLEENTATLISIVSDGFAIESLVARAVLPCRVVLLHTNHMEQRAREIQKELEEGFSDCQVDMGNFEGDNRDRLRESIYRCVERIISETAPDRLIFNLTGGKKIMSLVLYEIAPSGSHIICLESGFDSKRRRPIPYTERLHMWQKP